MQGQAQIRTPAAVTLNHPSDGIREPDETLDVEPLSSVADPFRVRAQSWPKTSSRLSRLNAYCCAASGKQIRSKKLDDGVLGWTPSSVREFGVRSSTCGTQHGVFLPSLESRPVSIPSAKIAQAICFEQCLSPD